MLTVDNLTVRYPSTRRAAFASRVRAAASRRSAADRSNRVIVSVIAVPLFQQGLRIILPRAAPIHFGVNSQLATSIAPPNVR